MVGLHLCGFHQQQEILSAFLLKVPKEQWGRILLQKRLFECQLQLDTKDQLK